MLTSELANSRRRQSELEALLDNVKALEETRRSFQSVNMPIILVAIRASEQTCIKPALLFWTGQY